MLAPIHTPTHTAAIAAIEAARHWRQWGPFAASRYAAKRGAARSLVTLCRVLEAARKAGFH